LYHVIIAAIVLIGAPLTGPLIKGEPVSEYLHFPPKNLNLTIDHALILLAGLFCHNLITYHPGNGPFPGKRVLSLHLKTLPEKIHESSTFPWWGWIGATIMVGRVGPCLDTVSLVQSSFRHILFQFPG
jgi:hypothetical protein